MRYTKEQLEKLPKWAQMEITSLHNNNESLEKRLSEFEGKTETNTYIRDGLSPIPLPNNAVVQFQTGDRKLNSVTVYVRGDGTIDFNSDSRLRQDMVIMPRAANSFYIKFIND